jgi:hypothetical protein
MLEPPSADSRLIWDIYFSAHILPVVALADELGVFALFEATPLSVKEAATRLNVTDEWAEILLGALASLQLVRLQDGRFHNADAARSFLLPTSPYYAGFSLRRFATRNVWERLKRAVQVQVPALRRLQRKSLNRLPACTSSAIGRRGTILSRGPRKVCARCTAFHSRPLWRWPGTPIFPGCAACWMWRAVLAAFRSLSPSATRNYAAPWRSYPLSAR